MFGDPLSYGRHLRVCRRRHRESQAQKGPSHGPSSRTDREEELEKALGGGGPSPPPDLSQDFLEETKLGKRALDFARIKQRLKQTDPELYRVLYGASDPDPTRALVNLEVVRYLKTLREVEEPSSRSGDNQLLALYQQQIQALQNKIAELKEELRNREIEYLRKELEDIKNRALNSSDTAILLSTIKDLAQRIGDRLEMVLMASRGFVPEDLVSLSPPPQQTAGEEERGEIIRQLAPHGLVVKVIDKNKVRSVV